MSKLHIQELYAEEILGMGGPYIGTVIIDGIKLDDDCVLNNYVFIEISRQILYVKYHQLNNYRYFTINFLDLDKNLKGQFDREFDVIYIDKADGYKLDICHAFHNKSSKRSVFNLDEENFKLLNK